MRQFLITVFGTLVGVVAGVVMLVLVGVFLISATLADLVTSNQVEAATSRDPVVLEIDLRIARPDQSINTPLLSAGPISLVELTRTIHRASQDEAVSGLFIRAGEGVTPADAEEIRRALLAFRASGKPVVAHIQSLTSGSTAPYLAVSAADEILMHPSGWFAATGLRAEQVFFGDGLAQLGAEAQFLQLYEYKGAAEVFTRSGYSDAAREATRAWLTSLHSNALESIALDRELSLARATQVIENGPYLATQAVELGLVDGLAHAELARAGAGLAAPRSRVESIEGYARRMPQQGSGPVIAVISGQGPVVDGPLQRGFATAQTIASDTLAAAIDAASNDRQVRAVVIRLDTGGGSATASDQIAAAILRARQRGLPVVVSMGSVAASGGYYIAAPADHIVANAGTLTGSIGVISGKVAVGSALEPVGITFDSVTVGGEFTGALSAVQGFTPEQRAAIEAWATATYQDFTGLVAEGRDLPLSRVDELARGRVWTGAQALELGLIDEIGGFQEAIATARRLASISPDQSVSLKPYPAPPEGLEQLALLFGNGVEIAQLLQAVSDVISRPEVQAILRETQSSNAPVTLEADAPEPD